MNVLILFDSDQHILCLDISMSYVSLVKVVHSQQQLAKHSCNHLLRQLLPANNLVKEVIPLAQFRHYCEVFLVAVGLQHAYDVRVVQVFEDHQFIEGHPGSPLTLLYRVV